MEAKHMKKSLYVPVHSNAHLYAICRYYARYHARENGIQSEAQKKTKKKTYKKKQKKTEKNKISCRSEKSIDNLLSDRRCAFAHSNLAIDPLQLPDGHGGG